MALGQFSIFSDNSVVRQTVALSFQNDSDIWQSAADFKWASIFLAYSHILYTGDLSIADQYYERMKEFSLLRFFNDSISLLNKLPFGSDCGIGCSADDLIDWPPACRDGYVFNNIGT